MTDAHTTIKNPPLIVFIILVEKFRYQEALDFSGEHVYFQRSSRKTNAPLEVLVVFLPLAAM